MVRSRKSQGDIVDFYIKNWYMHIVSVGILILIFYPDSKDGYIDQMGGMPVEDFKMYFIPLLIISWILPILLGYYFRNSVKEIKEEIEDEIKIELLLKDDTSNNVGKKEQ